MTGEMQIDKHKRALDSPSPQCQLHQIMAILQTWLAATSLLGQVLPMPILLKKDLLSSLIHSQCLLPYTPSPFSSRRVHLFSVLLNSEILSRIVFPFLSIQILTFFQKKKQI